MTAVPVPSLFRHAYLAFPLLIAVPRLIKNTRARVIYAAVSLAAFFILLYAYVMNGWII